MYQAFHIHKTVSLMKNKETKQNKKGKVKQFSARRRLMEHFYLSLRDDLPALFDHTLPTSSLKKYKIK